MPVSVPVGIYVGDDPFRMRLLRAMGIDPEIAGDMEIKAPASGVYVMNIWLYITPQAWEAAQKGTE